MTRRPFHLATLVLAVALSGCTGSVSEPPDLMGDDEGVRWTNGNPDFDPATSALIIPLNKTSTGLMSDFQPDDNCFYAAGNNLKKFYQARGATVRLLSVNTPEGLIANLETLIKQQKTFDRVIFLAHGGYDGPMYHRALQIGLDWPEVTLKEREGQEHKAWYLQKAFLEVGALLNQVTNPTGWIWVGSCNAATEGHSLFGAKRYTDNMACATARMSYGVATKTACWDVENRVKKLEDGIKTAMLWRSNPANLPEEMLCYGEAMPEMPPLAPPPDLTPAPEPQSDAGPPPPPAGDGGVTPEPEPEPNPDQP